MVESGFDIVDENGGSENNRKIDSLNYNSSKDKNIILKTFKFF